MVFPLREVESGESDGAEFEAVEGVGVVLVSYGEFGAAAADVDEEGAFAVEVHSAADSEVDEACFFFA